MIQEQIMIVSQLQKQGLSEQQIATNMYWSISQLRNFRLVNNVRYNDDVKNNYLDIAREITPLLDQAYFPVDLSRLTKHSISTIKIVLSMFNLKTCKKAYCVQCGKELHVSFNIVPKYCNKSCRGRYYRELEGQPKTIQPIIKTCWICNREFEGAKNSRYCSEECKNLGKDKSNLSVAYLVNLTQKEIAKCLSH